MEKINSVSIIVSVYNEEDVLKLFVKEIFEILVNVSVGYELIFVNDGSIDSSNRILKEFAEENEKIKVIEFSKNFGHESAMIAGIDYSSGDGIICMDADLQHPVGLIPEILKKLEAGYDIVTMVRTKNKSAGLLKNVTSALFYAVLNKLSTVKFDENASDFFAITRKPAEVLKNDYREKMRFLRGFVQNIGFDKTSITYEANDRAAGDSKYSISKLMNFSINALLSFSNLPLKVAGVCGGIAGLFGIIVMVYTIVSKALWGTPSGYASIIVILCFMFAILFVLLGILGEYIGILFYEVKARPIYIIKNTLNVKPVKINEKTDS